jgi:hypothetical protein
VVARSVFVATRVTTSCRVTEFTVEPAGIAAATSKRITVRRYEAVLGAAGEQVLRPRRC